MLDYLAKLLKGSSGEKIVTLAATSSPCLEANARRISITFCPPTAGTATYSTLTPAVAGRGIVLRSTDRSEHRSIFCGDIDVGKAWNCIHSAGGETANIIESWLGSE